VQFFTEVGASVDDLDGRFGRRKNQSEADEIEAERREKALQKKINLKFHEWTKATEQKAAANGWTIRFERPEPNLLFYGCHSKSTVKMMPTENCLVNLTEMPYFIAELSKVEIAHLERVSHSLKSFDLVLVMKDFQTWKRINSIPSDYLEPVKDWLT